jgi:hypothetical protein
MPSMLVQVVPVCELILSSVACSMRWEVPLPASGRQPSEEAGRIQICVPTLRCALTLQRKGRRHPRWTPLTPGLPTLSPARTKSVSKSLPPKQFAVVILRQEHDGRDSPAPLQYLDTRACGHISSSLAVHRILCRTALVGLGWTKQTIKRRSRTQSRPIGIPAVQPCMGRA